MIQEGYDYYSSRRLGRVPIHAVEHILGVSLSAQKDVTLHGECV